MIELYLLKGLSIRSNFKQYRYILNPKKLSEESLTLLKDFEVYFSLYEDKLEVDFSMFLTWFFEVRHPYFDEKTIEKYKQVFKQLSEVHVNGEIKDIFNGFEKQEFYNDLIDDLERNIDDIDLKIKVDGYLDKKSKSNKDEDIMSLDEVLERSDRSNGLKWRTGLLNNWFQNKGLINGDLVIVAASPGAGKTSFMANEASYMASQLKDGNIYILSNEDDFSKTFGRVYTSALGCTEETLRTNREKAELKYKQIMGGDPNRIVVKGIQGWSASDVESFLLKRKDKARLIIIDLLDNIQGFDRFSNKESSFEKYNKLYQWARELSVQFCPVIVTSQMNAEGDNNPYPKQINLRGSQIDKQAAGAFQIMIGSITGNDNVRYFSLVKDKMSIGYKKGQVQFDPLKARFK